ncbi:MAG: carbonic anhydrase [Pseudobdellovibrio sp.]
MARKEIMRLLKGFKQFREKFFDGDDSIYHKLSTDGQVPKTLIIGCSDSRVDPAIISSAGPGELFVVRNVANIVPPYDPDSGRHGVSSAIEFAVVNLKVDNVIILGHRQCGGIRALLFPEESKAGGFVQKWMKILDPAKQRALAKCNHDDHAALWHQCELEGIRTSIENLRSFPFIEQAIKERNIEIVGVYFDLEKGELLELNEKDGSYSTIG